METYLEHFLDNMKHCWGNVGDFIFRISDARMTHFYDPTCAPKIREESRAEKLLISILTLEDKVYPVC